MTTTGKELSDDSKEAIRFLCRHLVSFGWIDWLVNEQGDAVGQPRVHCQSGFIMAFRGVWMLATAGHIIQELETLISNSRVHIEAGCLMDGWSIDAVNHDPIPFDLVGAKRFYIHDDAEGLDFGFILLSPLYQKMLLANGIQAVDEERWRNLHQATFSHYGVLGIPEKRVTEKLRPTARGLQISSTADPYYVPVTWVDNPPSDLPKTTCPRFIGLLPEGLPVEIIPGMSGGPIFAFGEEEGVPKYWIVAIQSALRRDHRMIFGCLLPYVGGLVERDIDEWERTNTNEGTTETH